MALEFASPEEAHRYARDHGLILVLEGTSAFKKRQREMEPNDFRVVPVLTRKGKIKVGLFAGSEQPRRASLAAMAWRARRRAEQHSR